MDSGRFVLTSDCPKAEMRDAARLCGDSLRFCVDARTLLGDRWETWTSGCGSSKQLLAYRDWGSGKFSNLHIIFSDKTPSGEEEPAAAIITCGEFMAVEVGAVIDVICQAIAFMVNLGL